MMLPASWRPALVVLFALLLFPFTERGQLPPNRLPGVEDSTWRSLNNYSLLFLEIWRENGAWASRFGLGIPLDGLDFTSTKPYSSYPPGYLVVPYLLEKSGTVAPDFTSSLARLRVFARFNHLVFACLAGWAALLLAGELAAALAAVAAALFLPPFLLFLHNVWWVDLAGLTCAATLFLLHVRFTQARQEGKQNWSFGAALLAGGLVDWFTPMLGALCGLVASKRRRVVVVAGLAGAALVFLLQQWALSGLLVAAYKLRVRTGLQGGDFALPWLLRAWLETVSRFLGPGGLMLPPLLLGIAALTKEGRRRLLVFWPLPAAALLHWLVFNQHYPGHHYNTVRWAFVLCLLPALIPRWPGRLAAAALVAVTISLYPVFERNLEVATTTDLSAEKVAACRLVERHRSPEHLFVSAEFHFFQRPIDHIWLFPLCKSMVAEAHEMEDVVAVQHRRFLQFRFSVARVAATYYLGKETAPPPWASGAKEVDHEAPWHLYELPPL